MGRDDTDADDSVHVLHVDDEPEFAETAATFVEREDDRFDVSTATSAGEGLDRLAGGDVDCVVSDYDMPGRNGIEFLEAVREDHPDLPFILYTGKGSEEVASDAISAGVTDYLQKDRGTGQYAVLANRVRNAVEKHRAQAELADRERRLDLFFEQSPLGVIEWGEQFDFVRLNGAAEDILGYSANDLAGQSWEAIVPESDREAVDAVVSDLLENRGGYHSVNENVREDGERIVCEWHNRVVTNEDDDVVAVFSQFRDVTDREQHVRRLETLVDNFPGMVYRCSNERGWPMKEVGGEVEDLTGYPASILERREDIYGSEIIHPADRDAVWNAVQDAFESGEPFELTYRIRTEGGDTRWVWERGQEVETERDDVAMLEGFITDISERERATRDLRETNTVLRTVLENLPAGILVEDADRNVLMANETLCEILDASIAAEELIGRDCAEAAAELQDLFADPGGFTDEIEATIARREPVRGAELRLADGRTLERDYVPYRLPDGDANLWFYRDVTERNERERKLERQNERLEEFAGVVSHDLRNPLNVAEGRVELAKEDCASAHLDEATDAIERSQRLIDDVLTLAREGEALGDVETVALAALAERCWGNVETAAATLVADADRTLHADRSRLQQLLENLFRNAVEHGGEDVTVTLGDLPDGFYVADDGPGAPGDERADVFRAGYSTLDGSTGFGLAIVERIAEAHGWDVAAVEGEGGGARFEVTGVESG